MEGLEDGRAALRKARGVVMFTGAGVSAESGVPTFRDPTDGLWSRYRPEELASAQAFARDPVLVWRWYADRRRGIRQCRPNPAHTALARFLLRRSDATLVTQNVDGLHQLALEEEARNEGSPPVEWERMLSLHGDIFRVRCTRCPYGRTQREPMGVEDEESLPRCPDCDRLLRPDVVWFGEVLPREALEGALRAARRADICLVVGTSAVVYPAASIPRATLDGGGRLIEVNPARTALSALADWRIAEPAGRALPALLDRLPDPTEP